MGPPSKDFSGRGDDSQSVMTYRGHAVCKTLIRCHFSPLATTGQQYVYSGSADGRIHVSSSKHLKRDSSADPSWTPPDLVAGWTDSASAGSLTFDAAERVVRSGDSGRGSVSRERRRGAEGQSQQHPAYRQYSARRLVAPERAEPYEHFVGRRSRRRRLDRQARVARLWQERAEELGGLGGEDSTRAGRALSIHLLYLYLTAWQLPLSHDRDDCSARTPQMMIGAHPTAQRGLQASGSPRECCWCGCRLALGLDLWERSDR